MVITPPPPDLNLDSDQIVAALSSTTMLTIGDLSGTILYANELFCAISGYSLTELKGKSHGINNSGFHSKKFWDDFWHTISTGKVWRGEVKNKKKNGEFYWVYNVVCPQFDKDNKIYRYISFRYDISEQKNLETTLIEEKNTALHLGKLAELGEMASSVAHEINNPLAIISGTFAICKKNIVSKIGADDANFNKHADTIEKGINRVIKIVRSFQEFSRKGNNDSSSLNDCTTSLIFENCLNLISEKLKIAGVTLETSIEESHVFCDLGQIEQVLINLIINSSYEVKNHNDKWIRVASKVEGDFVEFSVTDSGNGIPKEIQEKLMRPFFTTKPVGQGTGLGLSICKKIVEEHGGEFKYDEKSPNTRFVFLLPKTKDAIIGALNAEKAITAHQNWKLKLIDEYKNKATNLDPEKVRDHTACDLGQWITKSKRALDDSEDFKNLIAVHKDFHVCTSEIVKAIHNGETAHIKILLSDSDSDYSKLSKEVVRLLKKISSRK